MCYACEHPLNASTDEKSVWLKEYREWAQCDEAEAQSIYDEIVENADPEWGAENYLLETQYCECGGGIGRGQNCDEESICDPEADTDDEDWGSIDIDDVEEIEPETAEEIEEVFQLTMAERLAEYREKKKKVLDSFEIIRQHPLEGVLPDLYRDIETGRTFDLDENEYHEYPHIGWALL